MSRILLDAGALIALDRNERAISDLTAADFSVRIDGTFRRVVTAEWIPKPATTSAVNSTMSAAPIVERIRPFLSAEGARLTFAFAVSGVGR